jgi:hypothetical protein
MSDWLGSPHGDVFVPCQVKAAQGLLTHIKQRLTALQSSLRDLNSNSSQLGMPSTSIPPLSRCEALLEPFQVLLGAQQV